MNEDCNENGQAIDWSEFGKQIAKAKTVAIVGHVRPDGDVIGSSLAMKRALTALGKEVLTVNGQPTPPALKFVDAKDEIRPLNELTPEERAFVENVDVLMSVDVSSWGQLGEDASALFRANANSVKIVIDHHAVGDSIGDFRFVDPNADSAGSLVFDAIASLGVPFTKEIAEPLFVAISTDTGWFRFASTKASTLRRTARLVDSGVAVDAAYRELNERESFGRFRLMGFAATNCKRFLNDKGVFMSLSLADFDAAGAIPADSEDLVNEPLSVDGTRVSLIAIEQRDGSVKASFRSRCALDCAKLAKEFGGGGHARAAGATLRMPLEDACEALLAKTTEYYNALR